MVRRLFINGICSYTSEETFRVHFEQFGELYECHLPEPCSYTVYDHGKDEELPDVRSSIKIDYAKPGDYDPDSVEAIPYDSDVHGTIEEYMELVKTGQVLVQTRKKTSRGYGFITFVDHEGFEKCTQNEIHLIDGVECSVELFKEDEPPSDIKSKRLFVSFFPLPTLTAAELKRTFGPFGKITDVEFVKDNDGPLYFCLITFTTSEAVDECIKAAHYVQDVKLFVRRGITREAVKISEQKAKERSSAGYRHPISSFSKNLERYFPLSAAKSLIPKAAVNNVNPAEAFDANSTYGYGTRPW